MDEDSEVLMVVVVGVGERMLRRLIDYDKKS